MRGSLAFSVILLIITIVLLVPTMSYPVKSKLFPMIALSAILILLIIEIVHEVSALRRGQSTEGKEAEHLFSRHFAIWAWLAGTLVMLWLLGFMGTVLLLPFLYLRAHKEGWPISIILPLGCGVFFYALFGWALRMPLYPGVLLSMVFE